MIPLAINWAALGTVAAVTILTAVAIAALMSAANWILSGPDSTTDDAVISTARKVAGYAIMVVIGLIVLFGIYLMIPYFR